MTRCFRARHLLVSLLAASIAGCSGVSSVLTPQNVAQRSPDRGKIAARLVFKVPHKKAAARRSRYISPATQSVTVDIAGTGSTATPSGFPKTVSLTPASSGCTATLASTNCTLTLELDPGTYEATIVAYDGTRGTGNALSAAQSVPFALRGGAADTIAITLGGIPAGLAVAPAVAGYLRGGKGGLTLYGPASQKLVVEALDADGNIIAGPGAPTLSVAPTTATTALTVASPARSAAANVFTLTASTTGSPAVVRPGSYPLTVTATAVDQGANPVSLPLSTSITVPLRLGHSVLYVSDYGTVVHEFYDGNTGSANATITNGIDDPECMAVDANGTLYVANLVESGDGAITEYPAGSTSPSATITSGISIPTGVAVDANGTLYVANTGSINGTVAEYPAGATSPNVTISSGIDYPFGMAVDANGTLYVANLGDHNGTVTEYLAGTTSPSATISSGLVAPRSVAFDATGTLYVGNSSNVAEYPAGSTSPSVTISSGIQNAVGVAVDANGTIYVANEAGGTLTEYPAGSTQASVTIPSSSLGEYPQFVAVVPAALAP
jgi:sugar lactone lactonase YvrE